MSKFAVAKSTSVVWVAAVMLLFLPFPLFDSLVAPLSVGVGVGWVGAPSRAQGLLWQETSVGLVGG